MSNPEKCTQTKLEEVAEALDTLRLLGAAGLIRFGDYEFELEKEVVERVNHPGSYSPYVRIFGQEEGFKEETFVITKTDFSNFVGDYHSHGAQSGRALSARISRSWAINPEEKVSERAGANWGVWSTKHGMFVGVNPKAVTGLFGKYLLPEDVPRDGIAIGPEGASIWHGLARHILNAEPNN
jgi:hypothetical protein